MDVGLLDKIWMLPAIMAASFLLILFVGKRFPEKVTGGIGIVAVSVCFVLSLFVAGQWIARVNHPPEGAEKRAAELACGVTPAENAAEQRNQEQRGEEGKEPIPPGQQPRSEDEQG